MHDYDDRHDDPFFDGVEDTDTAFEREATERALAANIAPTLLERGFVTNAHYYLRELAPDVVLIVEAADTQHGDDPTKIVVVLADLNDADSPLNDVITVDRTLSSVLTAVDELADRAALQPHADAA